jgi:hypothetical protein
MRSSLLPERATLCRQRKSGICSIPQQDQETLKFQAGCAARAEPRLSTSRSPPPFKKAASFTPWQIPPMQWKGQQNCRSPNVEMLAPGRVSGSFPSPCPPSGVGIPRQPQPSKTLRNCRARIWLQPWTFDQTPL